jgi:hypothetical protein
MVQDLEVGHFALANRAKEIAARPHERPHGDQAWLHHLQPLRVADAIQVVCKRIAGIVGRIDIDTLHQSRMGLGKTAQDRQVIAMDQQIAPKRCTMPQLGYQDQAGGFLRRRTDVITIAHPQTSPFHLS